MSALQFPDTETPLPALEGDQGLQVVVLPEVGPQRVREEELRVRRLPQQEVQPPGSGMLALCPSARCS